MRAVIFSRRLRRAKPVRPAAAIRLAALAAALFGFMGAAHAQVPVVDIDETCRIAASAMVQLMGGSTSGNDKQACLNSEQRARETIIKDWGSFSANDRGLCVQTGVYLPSYVEWLTCLEMNRDVRKMAPEHLDAYAPVALPVVRPKVLY